MISIGALGRTRLALLGAALVVAACGGGTPSPAPTTLVTAPPQTFAPTEAPTVAPTVAPTTAATAGASADAIDPSDELEIAAPYTFEPLDEAIADVFISAMEEALGSMSDVFHVGVKSAVDGEGETAAWVIVMRFPDVPVSEDALLEGAAGGAAGETGTVGDATIQGQAVKIVPGTGIVSVLSMVNGDLVMAIGPSREEGVAVMTAIISAN